MVGAENLSTSEGVNSQGTLETMLGSLVEYYRKRLDCVAHCNLGFTPEEAGFFDGKQQTLESVIEDLENLMRSKET